MAEDLRLFGITGDWNTAAALDPEAWHSTVREGGCCGFAAAWRRPNTGRGREKRKRRIRLGLRLGDCSKHETF